ncbi:MAG: AGE family epimerase/isomerase [Prevotella sp.]|nr:AGE family epimerase/isomerase [Prevotella sp.]
MTKEQLKQSARLLLEDNILRFWLDKMQDQEHGGFYGRMDGHNVLHPKADKGCVLNARILWTFAAAYRVLSNQEYLQAAIRAKDYILEHFIDRKHGGVYWSVDYIGRPLDMKKQSYAIGFTIYGMSELARATGDKQALGCAIALFNALEENAYDHKNQGYIEAMTYDWRPISDMRLSYKDENGSRTMNTHLHILESYTNLYRCLKASPPSPLMEGLEKALRTLIDIFTKKLLNPRTHHLDLFFDDQWQGKRNIESYGHDIEAAWLLTEALEVLDDEQLMSKTMPIVNQIAHVSEEGLLPDGSMIHEKNLTTGTTDADLHWWVQCENVIGQLNQYQHFHDEAALQKALRCYDYIVEHLVDCEQGEWYWSRRPDGTINCDEDKAGFWKCPYHNSRMCLEIIERFK